MNPTYGHVCRGTTGHAEAIQLTYDPAVVSFPELLEVFWRSHDPTTKDRQGNDVGSAVPVGGLLPHRPAAAAGRTLQAKDRRGRCLPGPARDRGDGVQRLLPGRTGAPELLPGELRQGYCRAVIRPKLDKLKDVFAGRLKGE